MAFAYLPVGQGMTVFEIILVIWRFSYICILLQPKRLKQIAKNFKHFNFAKLIQVSFQIHLKTLNFFPI